MEEEEKKECHCHDDDGCCHEGHDHCHCHDDDDDDEGCGCGCCCCHHEEGEEEEHSKKAMLILGIRIAAALTLALLGKFWLNEANFPFWVNLLVMLAAWAIIAYDVAWKAIKAVFVHHEPFDECTLMIVASAGAFALRSFGPAHNEFFEGVLVILLYQVGEVFEDLAADKSREAIVSALDLKEEKAKVLVDGKSIEKEAKELEIGDLVAIGNGGKILCDGYIEDGEGEVDESSLTGEFLPVLKKKGDVVRSGTILKSGSLVVKVAVEYKDSTVAKMLDLVQDNASKKSKVTRFITKFARVYTPIVIVAALFVAVIPPLFIGVSNGNVWSSWIFSALEFLVVSCPCAIVISVPLAYFAGLGLASKQGIIVKGAGYFDKLNEMKTLAFDKTGTLTEGKFTPVEISPKGMGKEEFLEYLSAAESRSAHPIAKALYALGKDSVNENEISHYEEIPGFGVTLTYKGHLIKAGKLGILDEEIHEEDVVREGVITHLSVDGEYRGYLILEDTLRESAKRMVPELKKLGVNTVLLSGDKEINVKTAAKTLGIDSFYANLVPEQKVERLHAEIDKGEGMVGYVGDGINDAPSIVLADIGIAMGGLGSEVAIANADVVLMNDDPARVVALLKIARKTRRRAIFNIAFSLTVKIGLMVAAVIASIQGTWTLPMWVAILGDTGLALLMVLSSLLLGYQKVK